MAKKLRVPDAPGGIRFCTACDNFLPVGEFPLGPRRYLCKTHMWATAGKKAKAKRMADANKIFFFVSGVKPMTIRNDSIALGEM